MRRRRDRRRSTYSPPIEASALIGGVVVLGHASREVRRAVTVSETVCVVVNSAYADGRASSLWWPLAALYEDDAGAVVVLADQPTIPAVAINAATEA